MNIKVLYLLHFYESIIKFGDVDVINEFYFILKQLLTDTEIELFKQKYQNLVYRNDRTHKLSDLVHDIVGQEMMFDFYLRKKLI